MGSPRTTSRRPLRAVAAIATALVAGVAPLSVAATASASTSTTTAPRASVTPAGLLAATDAGQAAPERVILTPPEHPDTEQSFTWRTGANVTDGQVSIRKAGDTTWRTATARANEQLESAGVPTRTHSVTVDGLTPGTEYEYFVGNGAAVSHTYRFSTAGKAGDPFTFIYFGDAQNDLAEKWTPVVKQAFDAFPDAVGTVNAGDLVNTGGNDGEWTEWFGAMDGYSQSRNVIAAPGNHEYGGDAFLKVWKSNFEYDANGPKADPATGGTSEGELQKAAYEKQMAKALEETAYYTDYQGVRFISLNASREQAVELMTPTDLPPCHIACPNPSALWLDMQSRWLDSVLANNPNKWAVAVFHQPVFSTAEGRDEVDVRESWLPVFQRNDIDLVLMGHDHTYGRGFVNADATDTPGVTTGPVYTVTVSGPKYYELQPEDDNVWTQNGATMVTRAGHTSTFQGITVTDDQIRYESIVAAKWDGESTTDKEVGDTLDAFTITKYDNGEKYVTEDGVAIPAEGSGESTTVPPNTTEEPAGEPADVPLGHQVIGTFTSPTAAEPGPTTVNPSTHVVYVADQASGSKGTVQAIDPVTGEVVDQFDVGAPVRDLAYDATFNGVLVAIEGGKIASYLTNPAVFGTPYIEPIPVGVPVRSLQYEGPTGLVFMGLDNGTIMWLDAEGFDVKGTFAAGSNLRGMRIDDVTGVLYATFDNPDDDSVGLRLYETRNGMNLLKEYTLDRSAGAVDIDMEKGLAYVGHTSTEAGHGGLSVVDLIGDTVTHYAGDEFGGAVSGVGVDAGKGIAYLASTAKSPAPAIVVGRQQAPRITASPVAQYGETGSTVTFSAAALGIPAPTVAWESRTAGSSTWAPIAGATGTSLEVVASDALHKTQYRAVFTNTIEGVAYSTDSATATLVIAGYVEPGTPEGEGDGDGTGTTTPADTTAGGKTLAATGTEPFLPVLAGLALMLLGAGAALYRQRRREQSR
ncbi:fibronectin type III domain-containing protein [Herbiconiux ginsengi]|uniref:LPXTG-motif cell wall anchor domain-containing protein n=1 Tax=Herbiconiux ginsengi TaxID=381665 RepID=A0A1H3L5W0_9MICO|nr:fibronectin type III domain-containing protein [Herbiconiux ginsengi]SDY59771.1 LPXTG-motif cell wall anchor domain-containing protein [Herbiconiux ginsengi]